MVAEKTAAQQPAAKSTHRSSESSRASSGSGSRAEIDSQDKLRGPVANGSRAGGQAWNRPQGIQANGHTSEESAGSNSAAQGRQSRRPRYDRPPNGSSAPCNDLDELRSRVLQAAVGTGQVAAVIKQSTFRPREPAFTRLIQACVPTHDWRKALEIWGIMRETPGLKPNTISYSVLIHVCGVTGRWEEAEEIFQQELKAAELDKDCTPNHITYSSLLTACTRGKRVDKALEWYAHMKAAGITADAITYSNLIPTCIDNGVPMERISGLVDDMHSAGYVALQDTYIRLILALAKQGLHGAAVEAFISAQMAGAEPTVELALAMVQACEISKRAAGAVQVVESWLEAFKAAPPALFVGVVRALLRLGAWGRVLTLWEARIKPAKLANAELARLLLDAAHRDNNKEASDEMAKAFQALGVKPASKAASP